MLSVFIKEQKRYSQDDLKNLFKCSEEKIVHYINILKEYSIIRTVKKNNKQKDITDLVEEDIEISVSQKFNDDYYYIFKYVGITIVENMVLKIYPKYIDSTDEPIKELKQILSVLEKYNSKEQIIKIFNNSEDNNYSFNYLALLLFFINDYYDNDLYSNDINITEENGNGEINWDRTINDGFSIIKGNKPYYLNYYTNKRISNNLDYFRQLHAWIISMCSKELKNADLLYLFNIEEIELSNYNLDDFGDIDYILYRIENELDKQFNTRKIYLLKAMYAYISKKGNFDNISYFSTYGTANFNLVWEEVIAVIFDNQLYSPLYKLNIENNNYTKDDEKKLIDLIEKPIWKLNNTSSFLADTLKPDTITFQDNIMYIYDAKYYKLLIKNNKIINQPGIESTTKQYLYHLAYKKFIEKHNITKVENYFVLPIENKNLSNHFNVSLEMMNELDLPSIEVIFIEASDAFDHYLKNKIYAIKNK